MVFTSDDKRIRKNLCCQFFLWRSVANIPLHPHGPIVFCVLGSIFFLILMIRLTATLLGLYISIQLKIISAHLPATVDQLSNQRMTDEEQFFCADLNC